MVLTRWLSSRELFFAFRVAYPSRGSPDDPAIHPSKIFHGQLFYILSHRPPQAHRPQHLAMRAVLEDVHDQFPVVGVGQAQVAAVRLMLACLLRTPLLLCQRVGQTMVLMAVDNAID
jgi:hypothetical protein